MSCLNAVTCDIFNLLKVIPINLSLNWFQPNSPDVTVPTAALVSLVTLFSVVTCSVFTLAEFMFFVPSHPPAENEPSISPPLTLCFSRFEHFFFCGLCGALILDEALRYVYFHTTIAPVVLLFFHSLHQSLSAVVSQGKRHAAVSTVCVAASFSQSKADPRTAIDDGSEGSCT